MKKRVTVYYLEMRHRPEFRHPDIQQEFEVVEAKIPCPELNRFMYCSVGGDWFWTDRLTWSYEEWMTCLSQEGYETWVGYLNGTPAGYFELRHHRNEVEIAYFGLLPQFVGRGLGAALFCAALKRGWQLATERVWLHTCTEDHPRALPFYKSQGLSVYDSKTEDVVYPDTAPGPWPDSGRPTLRDTQATTNE